MIRNFYAFKDDLSGEFTSFGDFVNDDVASRTFKMSCSAGNIPYKDLSLYRIASFETKTGMVSSFDIEFVCRGEKYEKE